MHLRGERVVLCLEPQHDRFEVCDTAPQPPVVIEEARVAPDVPKESLGHVNISSAEKTGGQCGIRRTRRTKQAHGTGKAVRSVRDALLLPSSVSLPGLSVNSTLQLHDETSSRPGPDGFGSRVAGTTTHVFAVVT
ncbi:MAG: hypothetical protein ACRDO8_10540, partial [Nocardioidaceae bacterium]